MSGIRIEKLTERNFADYERLTGCEGDGGCFCAFWHQKWSSMDDWTKRQKEAPELNRATVLDRVRSQFHVGVLAYRGTDLLAWISVGPLIDVYWAWRRAIQVGESAKTTAGITCITLAPEQRGRKLQGELLRALVPYGQSQGWTMIEGYPFDDGVITRLGKGYLWPGRTQGFVEAGFQRTGPHWLSRPEYERSIYGVSVPSLPV